MTSSIALYLISIFVSNIGNSIAYLVCGKASFDHFNLVAVFGAVILLEQFKSYFMSTISTRFVEHYGGKKVALYVDIILALITGIAAVVQYHFGWSLTPLIVILFINLLKPVYANAIFVLKNEMVSESEFYKVNSWGASAQQAGMFLGLSIAAVIVLELPLYLVFIIDCVTYILSALSTLFIKIIPENVTIKPSTFRNKFNIKSINLSFYSTAKENKYLLNLIILFALQIIYISIYNMALFKIVAQRFPEQSYWLAVFEMVYAASVSLFSIVIGKYFSKRKPELLKSVIFFQTLIFFGMAFSYNPYLFSIFIAFFALSSALIFPGTITAIQRQASKDTMAQVGALRGALVAVLSVPALILGSFFTDYVSVKSGLIFMGIICLASLVSTRSSYMKQAE